MTEIDFEELDRAVSSVMIPEEDNNDEVKPLDTVKEQNTSVPVVVTKKVSEEKESTEKPAEVNKKPIFAPRQMTRPSGRFMDVVHPSSDMRQKPASKDSQPSLEIEEKPKHLNMPDPLDIEDKAGDSPFLADAKVEKRPLGAFSEVKAQPFEMNEKDKSKYSDLLSGKKIDDEPKKEVEVEQKTEEIKEEAPNLTEEPKLELTDEEPYEAKVEGRNTHLPLELQKDILSVESDPTTSKNNINNAKSSKSPVALGDPYIHDSTPEITPQYKEKPSTSDQSSGSIYDTKEYHAALLHPTKSKNGWMTIVWVILIATVVIGASAAAYFLYFAK